MRLVLVYCEELCYKVISKFGDFGFLKKALSFFVCRIYNVEEVFTPSKAATVNYVEEIK